MPRKKIEVRPAISPGDAGLARELAEELRNGREYGQPLVYEEEYPTGKSRVTVIWDAWAAASLEERSSVILRAYEEAEGKGAREKVALASGLTVPEATAAGMLPFRVLSGLRSSDPIAPGDVEAAMREQGASDLGAEDGLQLRFATREEAVACCRRLSEKLPGSEPIWIISSDIQHVHDHLSLIDPAVAGIR